MKLAAQPLRIFDTDRELTSSLINGLFQDSNGMIWVATEEGLNCYDSNKFRVFRNNPDDNNSICSNYVNSLFENDYGELFVCTRKGIQRYQPSSRNFTERIKDFDGSEFTASVTQAIKDSKGHLWIVGDSIRRLDFVNNGNNIMPVLSKIPGIISPLSHIHCGICDSEGNIWLSQQGRGLICFNPDNNLSLYFTTAGQPSVSSMAIGRDRQLYLGTAAHGLLRFNSDNGTFETLSPSTGKEIKMLYVDSNGDILQATDGSGIIVYDPVTGNTRDMQFGNNLITSHNGKTHCVLRDNDDNLWIGMFQTGVVMLQGRTNSFEYLGHDSEQFDVIGRNCISSIFKDSQGTLWIGADNDGIYTLDANYRPINHYYNDDIAVPMCIFEDSRKNIWVGTYLYGVGMINRSTGKMNRINLPNRSQLPVNMCFAITEDRDKNIWLGMLGSGIIKYNLETGSPTIDIPWRDSIDPYIASIYYSGRTNSLYVGTYSGLQIVNNLSHANAHVTRLIDDDIVHSIDEGRDGTMWIATTNGLLSYEPKQGTLKRYGVDDGLSSSTVYAVRCDRNYVWMSLNSGISRLDTRNGSIANFFVGDGLQGNEFYKNSVFRDSNGHMYFGGTGGITHFDPKSITNPGREWTPRIIDIYTQGSHLPATETVQQTHLLELRPDQNTFSVEFGTMEPGRPESVRFAYSIDGHSWETLPEMTNSLNFYNLDPGKHKLMFRTVDGFTESPAETIEIAIAHPWYSAPWVIAIYLIIFVLILWWMAHIYTGRMRNKAKLVELQHSDQLNEARLQSYVNISHEIRTPMSLVISPLQKLIANDEDSSRQREYKLILRNAKRVLRLIDELMDLRKIEKNQMHLRMRETQIVPFIQDICDTFAQAVSDKRQNLTFNYSEPGITAVLDPANFDKIIMNLISNAVKYTPAGGDITVDLEQDHSDIIIKITDTGVGIPEKNREHIFERFYQVEGNNASGTGVGLHLTHQLVTLHGGSLTISDNPAGKGTCFTLRLPINRPLSDSQEMRSERSDPHSPARVEALSLMQVPEADINQVGKPVTSAPRILVVEDDEEIRKYLATELSRYYKVETASNGREALELIFKNPPHLVVSDIMMPEMDGLELTRTIKQNINLNHIPVILLTALTRDEDNISAIIAGADSYFTKPFNIEVVKERVAALLNRYRELKNRYSGSQEHDDKIDVIEIESADEKLIRRVVAVINANIGESELSVEKLASEVGLSRVHLHRKLKELTNQAPSDFIRNTRLRQAAHLLNQKKITIAEVAYATGFSSASSFSTAFKRLFGVTPSVYSASSPDSAHSEP